VHRYVHLILLSAERAYAHAMSMKTSGTEDGTGLPSATRQHIATRTHKAAVYARQLAQLLADTATTKATETDVLEARAYAFTLAGAQQLEKHGAGSRSADAEAQEEKWKPCLENYAAARVIYVALLKTTKDDVFKEHVASAIDPSIRFAAYQAHVPRTVPAVTVSREYFPSDEKELAATVEKLDAAAFDDKKAADTDGGVDIPNTITWRSRTANINDAAIGQALASVSTETIRLEEALESEGVKDKSAAYDPVLIAAQDAADATRRAIEDHEKEKISEADPRMQDLRVTNLAVNYDLIGWRVGRNRVLIGSDDGAKLASSAQKKPKKPRKDGKEWTEKPEGNGRKLARLRERVVLYDAILQSLDSVKEVPGAMRDATFVEELEGKKAYFQALKYVMSCHVMSCAQNSDLWGRPLTYLQMPQYLLCAHNRLSALPPQRIGAAHPRRRASRPSSQVALAFRPRRGELPSPPRHLLHPPEDPARPHPAIPPAHPRPRRAAQPHRQLRPRRKETHGLRGARRRVPGRLPWCRRGRSGEDC